MLLSSESLLYGPAYEMLYADFGIWDRVWMWICFFSPVRIRVGTCDFGAGAGDGCRGAEVSH